MERSRYIKEINRALKCGKEKKKEICQELDSEIAIALESGEDWGSIERRMGAPEEVVLEFNENLSEKDKREFKKAWKKKIGIIAAIILVIIAGGVYFVIQMQPKYAELGTSGVYTKEEVDEAASDIIRFVSSDEYDELNEKWASDVFRSQAGDKLKAAKESLGANWGDYKEIGSQYYQEVTQGKKNWAVTQVVAIYENRSVTYTISFNEDMKLDGLFMK